MSSETPFWKQKSLAEMTPGEWESLCDHCGRCCLHKVEDPDTRVIYYTDVACRLYDAGACRCSDYANRNARVPMCVHLTPTAARDFDWLPGTCAYRLLARGKSLPDWHPLVSGRQETVHNAGISIRNIAVSEDDVDEDDWEDHIIAQKDPA